jgi:mannose-6-phosphate isomerase-like protein (cupin superfamily)
MENVNPYEFIDFSKISGIPCPCGVARRALMNEERVPYSLHITEISVDARAHYHKSTSETYLILECDDSACIELNDQLIPVRRNDAIAIFPGTRHRAVGKMKVAIIATPKFDSSDEWFD